MYVLCVHTVPTYSDVVSGDEVAPIEENGEDDEVPAHTSHPKELGLHASSE
jgi:hypothetical protein